MQLPITLRHIQALALIQEDQPEHAREVLQDSGFGTLAEDWLQASQEFSRVASQPDVESDDIPNDTMRSHVVRAYALRCVSWARISQLRDQARRSIEEPH